MEVLSTGDVESWAEKTKKSSLPPCPSKIAKSQPDLDVCRQQILWFLPLHMVTMLRLLWLSQHLNIVLISSYRRNPSGVKPQEATTTTTTTCFPRCHAVFLFLFCCNYSWFLCLPAPAPSWTSFSFSAQANENVLDTDPMFYSFQNVHSYEKRTVQFVF